MIKLFQDALPDQVLAHFKDPMDLTITTPLNIEPNEDDNDDTVKDNGESNKAVSSELTKIARRLRFIFRKTKHSFTVSLHLDNTENWLMALPLIFIFIAVTLVILVMLILNLH